MGSSLFEDQAAGLRRLFAGGRGPTTVAFAGPPGQSAAVAALARGLAAAGKDVLVIDEQAGARNAAAAFGLHPRFDLLQAVLRDVPANRVLLRPEPSVCLLPAARAARQHARLDALARRALDEWLRRLQKGVDFVLANAADGAGAACATLLPRPQRIVVALSADADSITGAYARIKRLAQPGECRRFDIVVLRAAGPAEADTAFANLRDVARRRLGVELGRLTGAPAAGLEDHGRLLAEAFLDASRASPLGERAPAARHWRSAAAAHPVV